MTILKYFKTEDIEKIPVTLLDFFEKNCDENYTPNIDPSKRLDMQELDEKTKALLAMLYTNYLATEDERKNIMIAYCNNDINYATERLAFLKDKIKKNEYALKCFEPNSNTNYADKSFYEAYSILEQLFFTNLSLMIDNNITIEKLIWLKEINKHLYYAHKLTLDDINDLSLKTLSVLNCMFSGSYILP